MLFIKAKSKDFMVGINGTAYYHHHYISFGGFCPIVKLIIRIYNYKFKIRFNIEHTYDKNVYHWYRKHKWVITIHFNYKWLWRKLCTA